MDLTAWEIAALLCKLGLYGGTAAAVGSLYQFVFFHDGSRRHLRFLLLYGLLGAVLGFHAVLINFGVQIGLVNASGLAGMLDWGMASILMDTPQGEATFWRLAGFTAYLLIMVVAWWRIAGLSRPPDYQFRRVLGLTGVVALIIIAGSYRLLGHVSVLSTPLQLAQVAHIATFAIWTGSLLPLLWLARHGADSELPAIMRRFGDQALFMVGLLVAAGVLMIFGLLQAPAELWQTPYGRALLLKLLLVLLLLGLAALNRWVYVPALTSKPTATRLRRSIQGEILLATLILMLTAYLSTVTGPVGHQG